MSERHEDSLPSQRDEETAAWMVSASRARPADPLPAPLPVPVDRHWPAPSAYTPSAACRIVSCHPAAADLFPSAKVEALGRSPRGARRGRPSRLHSRKAGHTMRLTSGLEFDHALDCELDGSISRMVEQPAWVGVEDASGRRRFRPDMYVLPHREFREVKFEAEASTPEAEDLWLRNAAALNGLGYGYRVVTERHVREPVRYETVWRIFEDRHTPTPDVEPLVVLVRRLRERGPMTLEGLARTVPGITGGQAHALVRAGVLVTDLDRRLGPGTLFGAGDATPTISRYSDAD